MPEQPQSASFRPWSIRAPTKCVQAAVANTRRAYFGEWRSVPIYQVEELTPGTLVTGPAIFEAETTTVIIGEGDRMTANELGWLDISLREPRTAAE